MTVRLIHSAAAARESELLDEIREIKQAKDVDRRQFNAAMGAKDKQVSELESQLVGAKAEAESYSQQVRRPLTDNHLYMAFVECADQLAPADGG